MRRPKIVVPSLVVAAVLAVSGCGGTSDATPVACLDGAGAYVGALGDAPGEVRFWRCANERAQAQGVAAEAEQLIAGGVAPDEICVLVRSVKNEGAVLASALEERAVPARTRGAAAYFQRGEVRDVLAWLRALADPGDSGAVVRALSRPPVELRSVDVARLTQLARRRKLDMPSAVAAALEGPQLSEEGRDRARTKAFGVSDLGLIEMTRQRVRQSHLQNMTESCPTCQGTGRVFTPETIVRRVERSVKRMAVEGRRDNLIVKLHPEVAMYVLEREHDLVKKLEKQAGFGLELREPLQQAVDLADGHTGAVGDAHPSRGVDDLGVDPLLGRHRADDRRGAVEVAVVDLLELLLHLPGAGQHAEQVGDRAHLADGQHLLENPAAGPGGRGLPGDGPRPPSRLTADERDRRREPPSRC